MNRPSSRVLLKACSGSPTIARQTVQTLPEAEQGKIDGDRTKRERGDTSREGSDHQQPDEDDPEKMADAES